MKKVSWALLGLLFTSASLQAQLVWDTEVGVSKADQVFGELSLFYQINDRWRLGTTLLGGDFRYRFVDARLVNKGSAFQWEVFGQARLTQAEKLNLHAFFRTGLRWIRPDETNPSDITNYTFTNSQGITLDPGLLVSYKVSEKLYLFTGVDMHMAFQTSPQSIFEQVPSNYMLWGASTRLGKSTVLYAKSMFGPTFGAGGDAEKFFWQASLGIRFPFGEVSPQHMILSF